MVILAGPYAWLRARVHFAQPRDIDEQAVSHIDPAGVDDVHSVASHALDMVGVDIKQILSLDFRPVGVDAGIVVQRHVEILAQPCQSRSRDLSVEVPIPRHDLSIPPPA